MDWESISFGRFRLDLRRRELLRDGDPVRLHGRALDILCALAAAKGEVVGKDELMASLWPGRIVQESNIHVYVSALRKALDEHGEGHSYIITVPGRGYRLAGFARASFADDTASHPPKFLPLPDKPSIAVLPFANMSGDPNQDYFVDGLVDEIITALGRLRWLFVIARNSSFAFKGQAVDVKQIGRQLGVHYVLEGSVRRAGDRVRITSQLIETASGASMWGERLEGAIDDIFELQDQVASLVAGAIEPELQFAEISRTREKSAQILTAYDLYLRALAEAVKWDLGDCARPLPLLRRALAVDPSYAPAAGMLAGMRARQLAYGVQLKPEEIAEALKLARFVMQTGTEDAEALAWSGYALASLAGDKAGALHAINRALMLNPNNAFGWWACALVYYYEFKPDAAVRAIERAVRLSPLDPYAHGFKAIYACALMLAGRHDEAVCWIDQSLHEQPYHPFYVRVKIALSGHLDHSEQAKEWITRLLEIIPDTTIAWFEAYAAKFLSPETLGVWLEGLRRAGLPEA